MPFDWSASSSINFNTNGVRVFERLEKAAASLLGVLTRLDKAAASLDATLIALEATATASAEGIDDLTVAFRASSRAARLAARSYAQAGQAAVAAGTGAAGAGRSISPAGGGRSGGRGGISLPGIGGQVATHVMHAVEMAGEIGLTTAIDAVFEASKLQTSLQSIQNVTGASKSQMAGVYNLVFDQASKTAMSPDESARMLLDVARQTPSLSLTQKEDLLPYLGKSSVVLKATRGMKPEEVSEAMVSMVHLFQLYKPEEMGKGFDLFTRSAEMMGIGLNKALTQYSYFVPMAQTFGVDPKQDVAVMAELANMGLGKNRGGTGVQRFLAAGIGIKPGDKMTKAEQNLHELGIVDAKGQGNFYKKGADGKMHLDMLGMLDQLAKDRVKMGDQLYGQTVMDAYLQNAGKVVLAMTTATQNEQRKATVDRLNQDSLGLDSQFGSLMGKFGPTFTQALKNFQALATELGGVALPGVTKGFRDLGDSLHNAQAWLHQHQDLEAATSRYISGMVTNAETFLVDHQADFLAVGQWAARVWPNIEHVTNALGGMAGGLLHLIGAAETVNKWLDDHTPAWTKTDPNLPQGPVAANKGSILDAIQNWDENFLGTKRPGDSMGGLAGTIIIQQAFHGPADAKTVKDAAKAGVEAARQPRHPAAASGPGARTQPYAPLVLSVYGAHG